MSEERCDKRLLTGRSSRTAGPRRGGARL